VEPLISNALEGKGGQRRVAAATAICILRMLRRRGVIAKVVSFPARGRFDLWSDVGFPVCECPYPLIYRIESSVEDIMMSIEFDVCYRREARERVLQHMEECTVDERELLWAMKGRQSRLNHVGDALMRERDGGAIRSSIKPTAFSH
jgi:hypothetical protein